MKLDFISVCRMKLVCRDCCGKDTLVLVKYIIMVVLYMFTSVSACN